MIKLNNLTQPPEVHAAVKRVLDSGRFVKGPKVEEFETKWASTCSKKYAIGVSSGATALELAIQAINGLYGKGNQVTYSSRTFIAVPNAITRNNLEAIPSDDNPDIFCHHLHDTPFHYMPKIEDCSHCHGYTPAAETAIFSLFPAKILGAVCDAGIIVTDNEDVAFLCRRLRTHGNGGTNARMSEIAAASLLVKLPFLAQWIVRRKEIVALYDKALKRYTLGNFHYAYCIEGSAEKKQKLFELGVESAFYYEPRYMALPLYPQLTNQEVAQVIEAVKKL